MKLPGHTVALCSCVPRVLTAALAVVALAAPRIARAEFWWWEEAPFTSPREADYDLLFVRRDANLDGEVDISDPITVLMGLFAAGSELLCEDAADANDDGVVDISDPIFTLRFLFAGASAPAAPFSDRGADPTADRLECRPKQTADRWIFRIRPHVCPAGECDLWLTPDDEPSREGHLAAFSRWAQEGGAQISRI